jgi:hypothetical protein
MIALTKLRTLTVAQPSAPGRWPHISAASGLVATKQALYVVADDELHLGVFGADANKPGKLLRLFEGTLPDAKDERKRVKPDLEALTALPPSAALPSGGLLALSSGSTLARNKGAFIEFDRTGNLTGKPRILDCEPLLSALGELVPELNIEGAIVQNNALCLFQRGNNQFPENFMFRLPLAGVYEGIETGIIEAIAPSAIRNIDLGSLDGVPFSITDAAALDDGRMIVTAVAEDTASSYADGFCAGALIGLMDEQVRVMKTWRLNEPHKIEGVSARVQDGSIKLLLVTDADDPAVPAVLYKTTVEI